MQAVRACNHGNYVWLRNKKGVVSFFVQVLAVILVLCFAVSFLVEVFCSFLEERKFTRSSIH